MSDETVYHRQGREAARGFSNSQAFASLSRFITAKEAIRAFLPPVEEQAVQFYTPLPAPRREWLEGFEKELIIIQAENFVTCKCCGQKLPAGVET